MNRLPEGNAIVYCEGAYNTLNGKTAHGLKISRPLKGRRSIRCPSIGR